MTVMTFPFLPIQFHVEFDIGTLKRNLQASSEKKKNKKEQVKFRSLDAYNCMDDASWVGQI